MSILQSKKDAVGELPTASWRDLVCKPGSVFDSHLSRPNVAAGLQPPDREQPGKPCSHCGVAPDRVYRAARFHTAAGELLPRLSTLTAGAANALSGEQ